MVSRDSNDKAFCLEGADDKGEHELRKPNAQRLTAPARDAADPDWQAVALQGADLYEKIEKAAETMRQDAPPSCPQATTFQEAFDAAVTSVGAERWGTLLPAQQCAAIYLEMRRKDAERFGVAKPLPPLSRAPIQG